MLNISHEDEQKKDITGSVWLTNKRLQFLLDQARQEEWQRFREAMQTFVASREHDLYCHSWDEGLYCCLDEDYQYGFPRYLNSLKEKV